MAEIKEIYMDTKYRALRALIYILYTLSGLLVFFGVISGLSVLSANHSEYNPFNYLALAPVVAAFIFAFNFVVMAQIITVFIDMEWNQRETNELLQQIIKNQRAQD